VQYLAAHGLPIPKTILAKFPMNLQTIKRGITSSLLAQTFSRINMIFCYVDELEFTYPIIVKKASGSQGIGVIKVDTHEQMEDLVDMLDTGKPLIFQEMITASYGKVYLLDRSPFDYWPVISVCFLSF
jgi:gamma-F420-2:alpha-L-glutamate ligase